MKIISYTLKNSPFGETRMGIVDQDYIIDPNFVYQNYFKEKNFYNYLERSHCQSPVLLSSFLKLVENPIEKLNEIYQMAQNQIKNNRLHLIKLAEVKINKPLDQIGTYRDFFAHEAHVLTGFKKRGEKIPEAWYEMPVYYKGAVNGFIGPNESIPWPSYTNQLDYELELAIIIGKDGKNISVNDANKYIFGYTILNDISARDIQRKEMQVRLGPSKGKDFASIIGPCIITADEFNFNEPNLLMTASINGVEWSRGNSKDAHYTFAQMISHASKDEWILAGDLIGSGTVGTGCGLELDRWIKEDDLVTLEIEKIGALTNRVGKKNLGT